MLLAAWSQFLACSALIAVSGYWLARYGDVIGEKTGLGGTWVGIILVATVTSLPELVTGVSSVTLIDAPNIAVGDVLGSCVFNLLLIAILDLLYRETPLYRTASHGHILSAGFSIMLIGLATFGLLAGDGGRFRLVHVGMYTPAILLLYLVAVRAIYVQERRDAMNRSEPEKYADVTLASAVVRYAAAAVVVLAAGVYMPIAAVALAEAMGWSQSFVGTLLVAGATSLPEAAASLGALRIKAIDLAIGNLFGSNLFNILVLAIDDIAYAKAPLLSHASPGHALSGISAIMMTGAVVVGLHYRPLTRVFRIVGWVSVALISTYVLNSTVLYLQGH